MQGGAVAARKSVKTMKRAQKAPESPAGDETPARTRILNAAFGAFIEKGFSGTSTLDIATRAKVSKRELYALFENKDAMFEEGIRDRTRRMQLSFQMPQIATREDFVRALKGVGSAIMQGVTHDHVLAVHRLAIAESRRAPQISATLDKNGRQENRALIVRLIETAQAKGFVASGDAEMLATQFYGLMWGDLMVRLLMRVRAAPTAKEIAERAERATAAFLKLNGA